MIILIITVSLSINSRYASKRNEINAQPIPYTYVSGVGEEINLTFTGDIMCHDGQLLDAKTENDNYDFSKSFSAIAPYIYTADISMANLEGVIVSDEQGAYGYPYFFMPEALADELSDTGFDILSLCNTQSYNADKSGLDYTVNYLNDIGISAVGTNNTPLIIDKKGIKVGIVTYIDEQYITDTENKDVLYNNLPIFNYSQIRNDVAYCESQNADIIIAYVRWGKDCNSVPTTQMKDMARYLIASGIDVIVGSGPHAVMPMEVIDTDSNKDINEARKGYVFYSLGNFISNQRTGTSDMGAIVNLTVRKLSMDSTRVVDYKVTPVYTNVDIADGRNFKVVPVDKDESAPLWMDDTNKERFDKVYSVVNSIIRSFDVSERSRMKENS